MKNTIPHQQLFDRFAFGYYIVDVLSFGFAGYLRRQALDKMPFGSGSTVIDLMCGTGNNAKHIRRKRFGKLNYVGIDFSKNMIKRATSKYSFKGYSIRFINANIFDPFPEKDKSSHLLCTYGLKCIQPENYQAFIDTIDSFLISGGTLSLLEFQFPTHRLYRYLFKIYLHTIYRTGCLLFSGTGSPADALMESIAQPMDLGLLKKMFEAKGFKINVEERWMGAVIFIYGRKMGS